MSTTNPTYIIWGIVLPYPKEADFNLQEDIEPCDAYEPFLDSSYDEKSVNNRHNVTILPDGMSGEYFVIGHVYRRTDEYGNGFGVEPIPYNPDPDWRAGIEKCCAEIGLSIPDATNFGWYVITHYR